MKSYPHLQLPKPIVISIKPSQDNETEPQFTTTYYPDPDSPDESYMICKFPHSHDSERSQYRVFSPGVRRFVHAANTLGLAEQYIDNMLDSERRSFRHKRLDEWVNMLAAERR